MTALRLTVASLLASTALASAAFAQTGQLPPLRDYQTQQPERPPTQIRPMRQGVTGLGQTQDVIREPRFIVEAVSFKAVDESGRDLPYTSDEVFAFFEAGEHRLMTRNFDDVDSGEDPRQFDAEQSCIWPATDPDGQINGRWACSADGGRGPLQFKVTLYDDDVDLPPYRFCIGTSDLFQCFDEGDQNVLFQNVFSYEVSEVLQRLDPSCRCFVQTARQAVDSLTEYEFTFRITRVDDGREPPALDSNPGGGGGGGPVVHRSGALTADLNQAFEFDAGAVISGGGNDFDFTRSNNAYFLRPGGGARIWVGGATARGYAACAAGAANHVTATVAVPASGAHACYITSDGRVGELRINALTDPPFGGTPTLALDYTTWQ